MTEIPKGFKKFSPGEGQEIISYKTTGMGCLGLFIIVWLSIWTPGCVLVTYQAFWGENAPKYDLMLAAIPVWAGEFFVLGYGIWLFYSRLYYTYSENKIIIQRVLFSYKRSKEVGIEEIMCFKQIKDGGEEDDSFPSWGLLIIGLNKNLKILGKQPFEKSLWLGIYLSELTGKPFVRSNEPDSDSFLNEYSTFNQI